MEHKPTNFFDVIVIGGGAAGFFCAIQLAEMRTSLRVLILEKSNKVLAKVKISGGGRCNVTHHCPNPFEFAAHYPRGQKQLGRLFKEFDSPSMVDWLRRKGVNTKVESDNRVFPASNSSQTIIDCFMGLVQQMGIKTLLGKNVMHILSNEDAFEVSCSDGSSFNSTHVVVAIGGSPSPTLYGFISALGHSIIQPIASLFTFNIPNWQFKDLMGISVRAAEVRIIGTKFKQKGPLLITHWGLSGPAVIKLSAWAAEYLYRQGYRFQISVNWISISEKELYKVFHELRAERLKQKVVSNPCFNLPARLWEKLCSSADIPPEKIWQEISNRQVNKLMEMLIRCQFEIQGKTTYKEEFVTCGGVDLKDVSMATMESTIVKNLYFAGEVLHVDGETGGFNFQAAWTTAYLAAKSIAGKN